MVAAVLYTKLGVGLSHNYKKLIGAAYISK
jgi:hypothetical protein